MSDSRSGAVPLVSAVIPTRGRPGLVLRAVASVLAQTYPAIEVVVAVDGPDTATLEALAAVNDARLKVVALAGPVGGAEARNRAVEAASGKWIALLDDDDGWRPDKIEKQVSAALAADNPYAMIFSRATVRLPRIEYVWPYRLPATGEAMSEYLFCRKGLAFGEGFLQASSFFASRQMFLEVPFRKEQERFVDTDWLLRAAAHPKAEAVVLAEALAVYYMGFHYVGQAPAASETTDWKFLHRWAAENRELFTRRAFSYFIATQVTPRAARQREPLAVFLQLLKECLFDGAADLSCVAICFVFWLVPERARQGLRDRWERWRRRHPKADAS